VVGELWDPRKLLKESWVGPLVLSQIPQKDLVPGYEAERHVSGLELGLRVVAGKLPDTAFKSGRQAVLKEAVRMLLVEGMDSHFASSQQNCLFALALADRILTVRRIGRVPLRMLRTVETGEEMGTLQKILRLVALGATEDGKVGTLSSRVRLWQEQGLSEGMIFVPDAQGDFFGKERRETVRFLNAHTNRRKTAVARRRLLGWGKDSMLRRFRARLGITQENESPIDVRILSESGKTVLAEQHCDALHFVDTRGKAVIVLSERDYEKGLPNCQQLVEHEVGHEEGNSFDTGFGGLLFLGLTEAIIEERTSRPDGFLIERKILNYLFEHVPDLKELVFSAFAGNQRDKRRVLFKIVSTLGLEGFLMLARMIPKDYLEDKLEEQFKQIAVSPWSMWSYLLSLRSKDNE
jgi:hypothetical protein